MSEVSTVKQAVYSTLAADVDLCEIVEMFVEEMPERIELLLRQGATGNWEELTRLAHQLKGAAGSYGFGAITPYAARLENSLRAQAPEQEIQKSLEELVELCGRVRGGVPE